MSVYSQLYRRNRDGATVEIRHHGTKGDGYLFARRVGMKKWTLYAWSVFLDTHEVIATTSATTPEVTTEPTDAN